MRESLLEKYLRKQVRERGGLVYKFVSPAQPGVPDNIVLWEWSLDLKRPGVDFVELKTDTGKLSPIQLEHLRRLTEIGMRCYVLFGQSAIDDYIAGDVLPWSPN